MKKKMITIGGKRFVTPGVFADGCGKSTQKITAACKDGRIIGACQDSSRNWIIPVNAMAPLEIEQIRQLMIVSLYLKNKPEHVLDYSEHDEIVSVYSYLQQIGYIYPFNENSESIPYEVILTEKGMKIATEGSPISINWLQVGSTVIQVAASVLTIVQAIV